jgi:hypothetical protein
VRNLFYLAAAALVYPLFVVFELSCRFDERHAQHAAPRPPLRHKGRHTRSHLRHTAEVT